MEAKESLAGGSDFLQYPGKYTTMELSFPRERFWLDLPEQVKPFWQRLLQEKRMCRFSLYQVLNL